MKLPRFLLLLAFSVLTGQGGPALAQSTPGTDGVRALLQRLERIVQSADTQAYAGQLSETADRTAATEFAQIELTPGATRVVVRERDREALTGTLPGNGYRLTLDVFTEFGNRARNATWRLDVKRVGDGSDEVWLIADQRRFALVENLHRLVLDRTRQFVARDLTIAPEDLELTFAEAAAFVVDTAEGITGLVLVGRGDVRFHPTPEIEQGQLKIFCGSTTLQTRIDTVFARFNPEDAETLIATDRLVPRAVDPRDLRRAEALFRDEVQKSYAVDMSDLSQDLWSLMPADGDFLAEIHTARYDTLTYARSKAEAEDISFFDRKRQRNIAVYASEQALARHGRSYNEDDSVGYDVLGYDLDVSMSPDRLWIDGRARVQLQVRASALTTLSLRLAESLVVQSIVSDQFGRLFGLRVRNQNTIIVNLPAFLIRDERLLLTITYAGRLPPQREDPEAVAPQGQPRPGGLQEDPGPQFQPERSFLYSNRSYWYPQAPVTDYATASIRVTVPARFDVVASGNLDAAFPIAVPGKDAASAQKTYLYATSEPVRYLAFLVSRFVRSEPIAVPLGSDRQFTIDVHANPRQVGRARELAQRAGSIVEFYASLIGDCPYPGLALAVVESELPGGHSPGYFIALNQPLPNTPYVWRNDPASFENFPEFFLAHELAHQWWGQAVGWRNYHEQWISEGFAQYFAALYAQRLRGDDTFAGVLRQFRRWGMQQSDQGPIYLGYRLGHIRGDSRVFRAVIYNKSAAVLHMLRRLVGDDPFFRGIQRFYRDARFRKVGTEEFRAAMEAETGRPLQRFFERWIYGSTLPRLKFSYRVEPAPTGQQAMIHVEQTGDVFDLPLTLTLQYADGRDVRLTVPITDRVVDLPIALSGPLRNIDIDRDDGTLAEVSRN
ncbi:MAG: M1 family aminopeptidase [Acidobacteriota bacterium]